MLFKLDENLPLEAINPFRKAGHEAHHVLDEHLSGADDARVALVCVEENRALVTLDSGFGDITRYPPHMTAGIVVLRPERQDKATVLQLIDRLIEALGRRTLSGHLWIVTHRRIRIRA